MIDANEAMISASVGDDLDAALEAKADKSEIARLDAALAGKEAAGTTGVHNDSASAHTDIRNALKEKADSKEISDALSCHNTNAAAHADIRTRLDGKVDKASGMGLSSNDFTAAEKADVATNTAMRHNHNNKALLDSYTQPEANISDAVERKHSHENKSVLDGITAAMTDDWCNAVAHISDPVKHITAAERSSWNGKADKAYVDSSLLNKANVAELTSHNVSGTAHGDIRATLAGKANEAWAVEQFAKTMNKVGTFNAAGTLDDANQVNHWYDISYATGVGGLPPGNAVYYNNSVLYVFGQDSTAFTQMLFCVNINAVFKRRFISWTLPQWTPWEPLATATPPQEYDLPLRSEYIKVAGYKCCYSKSQDGLVVCHISVSHTSGAIPLGPQSCADLPAGFRPNESVSDSSPDMTVAIGPDGAISYGIVSDAVSLHRTLCFYAAT